MSESLTLPCPRCGAALPADPTRPVAVCAYCHTHVPIPIEVHRRALQHAARIAAAHRKADAAEQAASQMRFWSEEGQKMGLVMGAGMVAVLLGMSVLASVLHPYIRDDVFGVLMPLGMYGTLATFGIAYYVRYQKRKRAAAPHVVATSTCARCGGPLTFVDGGATAVCHACNATGLAGKTIVREMEIAAEQRADALELERARAERRMYRSTASAQQFGQIYMLFSLGWPVAALGIGGFVWGVSELVTGLASGRARDVAHGIQAFGVGCLLAAVTALVAVAVYALVLRPLLAPGVVLRALAAQLGGAATRGGTGAALDWLDAHWPAAARPEVMVGQGELLRHTLVTQVDGAPALVVVLAGGSRVASHRIHVLVAAPRARNEVAVRASPGAHALGGVGFQVTASGAGVALSRERAEPEVVNPSTLGWVLHAGAAVARA